MSSRGRTFRPFLEALESRNLLAVSVRNGVLNVVGTPRNDTVMVDYDSGEITVTLNDRVSGPFDATNINRVQIKTKAGDDVVEFFLNSDLDTALRVTAQLGKGNDMFDGVLSGTTLNANLGISVAGSNNHDMIAFEALGVSIADGVSLLLGAEGGQGDDTVLTDADVFFEGSGGFRNAVFGNQGRDRIGSDIILDADSLLDDHRVSVEIKGQKARDQLVLGLDNGAGGLDAGQISALVDGGTQSAVCEVNATDAEVQVVRCET